MNRTDQHIAAALRALDPADRHVDPTHARARADLEAVLAAPVADGPPARRPRRPRTVRLAVAGGLTAAVAGALVVAPPLTGGDTAFATWTPDPQPLTAQEQADAAASCRRSVADGSPDLRPALDGAGVGVAERRGAWTVVVLTGADGFSATCLSDDSAAFFDDRLIGSAGVAAGAADVGPRDLLATDLGWGVVYDAEVSVAIGAAGPEVTGVTYRSATHGEVAATVAGGTFALWFPGDELADTSGGVEVEVTYADGSTGTQVLTL